MQCSVSMIVSNKRIICWGSGKQIMETQDKLLTIPREIEKSNSISFDLSRTSIRDSVSSGFTSRDSFPVKGGDRAQFILDAKIENPTLVPSRSYLRKNTLQMVLFSNSS